MGDSRLERESGAADVAAPSEPHGASAPPAQQFHAQPGVSAARAAGATVLLDVRSGLYHTLNEGAGRVWDAIEAGGATLSMLIEILDAEWDGVPRETIARDVTRLVDCLLETGVITTSEQPRTQDGGDGVDGGAP